MTERQRGLLLVISGPSGVGKGSVVAALRQEDKNTVCSVSATTRKPRAGEREGVDYYFISQDEFRRRLNTGEFLEWAEVFDNYYGTLAGEVDCLLDSGKNVILEIDTQGAAQIKSARPGGISVFILPPSFEELQRRIMARGSETPETMEKRLARAASEIAAGESYDYQLVNEDVRQAASRLRQIIVDEKVKRKQGGKLS